MQWPSYADGQDHLMKWMVDTEAALRADVDLKNTLQEKRLQLQNLRSTIQQCECNVYDHQQYHDSLQAAVDWMTLMKDRVGMCDDISGDRHTLQNKFDRVQELLAQIPDNVNKISVMEEKGAKAMDTTALKGRQGIQQELDILKMDWENYTTQVRSLHDNLDRAIEHWIKYEEQHKKISHWVKDFPLKSTVEDNQHQLVRSQELMQ
ncbi:SYNE1 [Mytilus coruscus]|uniref:SYNE1 n=1 Tax=Mytilus coruscus TaxID=42192 RepID=A0A6J8EAN2_MYTCO|nr:SYNE1 [Mytilus coruscus]